MIRYYLYMIVDVGKQGGIYAFNIMPSSVEQAVDTNNWHIHNHNAIYGKRNRRDVRLVQSPTKKK